MEPGDDVREWPGGIGMNEMESLSHLERTHSIGANWHEISVGLPGKRPLVQRAKVSAGIVPAHQ